MFSLYVLTVAGAEARSGAELKIYEKQSWGPTNYFGYRYITLLKNAVKFCLL
jgi:hypothetical protein